MTGKREITTHMVDRSGGYQSCIVVDHDGETPWVTISHPTNENAITNDCFDGVEYILLTAEDARAMAARLIEVADQVEEWEQALERELAERRSRVRR